MHRALALYSGGLDSLLAILIVREQGIDVQAVKFLTGFVTPLREQDFKYAEKFKFSLVEIDISTRFIDTLRSPKHGFGKNLNPCVDCKMLMLSEIGKIMTCYGADFIISGDVVSQRLMSQRRETLIYLERKVGLEGKILRPLSAKLLPETKPEREGVIKRELLYDIWGRTRKPQIALAQKFGIEQIPQPSGGCLLTDPSFCRKVKDLLVHNQLDPKNVGLLRVGRHFRLSPKCKAVVGKNEAECNYLLNLREGVKIFPSDFRGAAVLLLGEPSESEILKGARICAFYAKNREISFVVKDIDSERFMFVEPYTKEEIESLRV